MFSGHFFLAVLAITIAVSIIQWFFIGFLFHRYQALTPSVWRKESSRSYAASTVLSLFFSFMFAVLFYLWRDRSGPLDFMAGIKFGALCWLTFSIPSEIGSAIYVNYSRGFVAGKLISSFFEYTVAGMIVTLIL